jgi:AmpE protein
MKFLVILICLTINYLWLKDFDRFDDNWFFKFRRRIEALTEGLASKLSSAWFLGVVLIYGFPLLVLAVISLLLDERGFGIPTMAIHILVLLVAFDRTQPGKLASDFLEKLREGDIEGCVLYLQQKLSVSSTAETGDEAELSRFFSKQLTYRCFEKMFVMFFWYMLAGPMGILFCYISYQLRDSHKEGQLEVEVKLIVIIIRVLEWVPLRLLAITFSLAGNFERCFENVKQSFWDLSGETESADLLYGYAACALSEQAAVEPEDDSIGQHSEQGARQRRAVEIEALQALLERSQAIWLCMLAIITIFGMQLA